MHKTIWWCYSQADQSAGHRVMGMQLVYELHRFPARGLAGLMAFASTACYLFTAAARSGAKGILSVCPTHKGFEIGILSVLAWKGDVAPRYPDRRIPLFFNLYHPISSSQSSWETGDGIKLVRRRSSPPQVAWFPVAIRSPTCIAPAYSNQDCISSYLRIPNQTPSRDSLL